MYNEVLKTKFVREITDSISTATAYKRLFDFLEVYETAAGKDLCQMELNEAQNIANKLTGNPAASKWAKISMIKTYCKWCVKSGIPNSRDVFSDIKSIGIGNIKNETVTSPAHLEKFLNEVFEKTENHTADNSLRCYCHLAYAGMRDVDIINVTKENVNFKKMTIEYNGAEYPIYREAVPVLNSCIDMSAYNYFHPNYNSTVVKERVDLPYIVRGTRGEPSVVYFRTALTRANKKALEKERTALNLSYYTIWLSGLFYKMYELDELGVEINILEFFKKNYPAGNKSERIIRQYKEDYERWKLAHNK